MYKNKVNNGNNNKNNKYSNNYIGNNKKNKIGGTKTRPAKTKT